MTRIVRRGMGVDLELHMGEQSERAHAELERQRLSLPAQPDVSIPRLPEDITGLDDPYLMELFTELTSWASYMAGQLACSQIDERASQRILDLAVATALLSGWKGGSDARVTVAKATIVTDVEVQRLRQTLDERYAYRKLVEVLSTNVERDATLVSREITRRGTSEPRRNRSDKWGN